MTNTYELETRFDHHPPSHKGIEEAHRDLRIASRATARIIEKLCPGGREKDLAMMKVEEAMFWANAAVARAQKVGE